MYFDFEDNRPDTPSIPRPMSPREVVLITVNLHLVFLVAILLGPKIPFVQKIIEARQAEQEQQRLQELERQRQKQEAPRFVFMQPRLERPTPPPKRAELSDIDRPARSVERAPDPRNPLPFSRGNTTERVDSAPEPKPAPPAAGDPPPPSQPAAPATPVPAAQSGDQRARERAA